MENSQVLPISNITNEILFVGSIYKKPEYLIEYSTYTKSKYDFSDEATKFFYDCAEIMYTKRSQTFNKSTITTFMIENQERLKLYKKYGGWKILESWMQLAIAEDFKNYFEVLKKFSLLREYDRNGFNVQRILGHPKFEIFTAMDIYRMIRGKADRIHTVILTNSESEILNSKIKDTIIKCMDSPDMGYRMPFPIFNDLFRGLKTKSMMAVGMLSNAGKSRFMFLIIAYVALVLKEKVCVLLNEMSIDEMRFCLLTTVINNPYFQELHGIKLTKKEREITLGLYKDAKGEFIYRKTNDSGEESETLEEYTSRVYELSDEYKQILQIAEWIEDKTQGIIFAKEVSACYDDKTLEFEIRKANLIDGVKLFFYDTLKQETGLMDSWAALKATTTKLSEIAKQLGVFVYGSIQLTDDTNFIKPDELTSSNISNAKQLKHVLDTLILFKEISATEISKYQYIGTNSDWGTPSIHDLSPDKRYYIGNVDKNRYGNKKKILFELNLDTNVWTEIGEVFKK